MRIETHNVYDPKKPTEVTIRGEVEYNLSSTNDLLRLLGEVRDGIVEGYVRALNSRLMGSIGGFNEYSSFDLEEMLKDNPDIKSYPDLIKSITRFTYMHLGVSADTDPDEKIMVASLNYTKSFRRLGYHRVKALAELLDDGVEVYKEIVARNLRAARANLKDGTLAVEMMPNAIRNWTNSGLGDFTVAVLDDHRVLYRFDKCLVPEAMRDFNDPDIAYLASCYTGDSPEWNPGRKRHMRRTQTLHHAPFCDEFYWDDEHHPKAKQPELGFTENLGKETS